MRLPSPRIIALLTAALALFMSGLLLAAYAGKWPPHTNEPTVFGPPF
ncbi:MAG TPA: hypothetical protein VE693_03560 [Gaiellaceae bacterium]|jgi:hypothetical protein|nr:hypothetical protein [Gaiellaceae bacterium]